jgi:hypothetical protein
MNEKHLHILQHSLGVDQYGQGNQYRNHYAVGPGCDGFDDCNQLVQSGHMVDCGAREGWGGMHNFQVTEKGIAAVAIESPQPPKITRSKARYQKFLRSELSMSFGEWLKSKWAQS